EAETDTQRNLAMSGINGANSAIYANWRERITMARAFIEAELDFADEDDVPDSISERVWDDLREMLVEMDDHVSGRGFAEIIRDGYRVAIMGPPNAGKSSLLNALAKRDIAIVSSEAGTTRDLVETILDIGGHKVIVTDTAGLRDSVTGIEAIGIEKAKAAANLS